jgi:hypothetical protein
MMFHAKQAANEDKEVLSQEGDHQVEAKGE